MTGSSAVHISSLVVHVSPAGLPSVKAAIEQMQGAEIHGESELGKLVVVLECDGQAHTTDIINRINGFAQVLGTALVFHQVEPLQVERKDAS